MENATCHLYFLCIHTRLKARVYTENTSDAWHIPWYPTRKYCIISMYLISNLHTTKVSFFKELKAKVKANCVSRKQF